MHIKMKKLYTNKDFDICNNTWENIGKRYKHRSLASEFSEKERVVVMVWTVFGIIGNGGFEFLFESKLPGDPNYQYTLYAFEKIGCTEAVKVIKQALSLFDNGTPPPDDRVRIKQYLKHQENIRNQINFKFWDLKPEIIKNLANYIIKNFKGDIKTFGKKRE